MALPLRRIIIVLSVFLVISLLRTLYSLSSSDSSPLTLIPPLTGDSKSQAPVGVEPLPHPFGSVYPPPRPQTNNYHEWNTHAVAELQACVARNGCSPNQEKVALLAAHWFEEAILRGFRGGEGVWAYSVYKALRAMGYTTLFANNFEEALALYRTMPDRVKVVIRNMVGECHSDPQCVKGPQNPTGIPAWKIFDFEYFPTLGVNKVNFSRMEGKWILSAHPHDDYDGPKSPIQFLGFSIEEKCKRYPIVPLSSRPMRAWILMKQLAYIYSESFLYERFYFPRAANELGLTFVGAWKTDQEYQRNSTESGIMPDIHDPANGVVNMGLSQGLTPQKFWDEMGRSRAMVGIGLPWWSPSPYEALCAGVPFVNPISSYDESDPWNKKKWYMVQHPSLVRFDPPYVYHVHKKNYTEFVDAVKRASTTEIGRFIPDYMTDAALRTRLLYLMETDWRGKAAMLLEERLKTPGSYTFEL